MLPNINHSSLSIMKSILSILFFSLVIMPNVISQEILDTLVLSKEGHLLKSRVKKSEEFNQQLYRYYRKSNNPLDQGKSLYDTMYMEIRPSGYMMNGQFIRIAEDDKSHYSEKYIGSTNYHFDSSTYLHTSKFNKTGRITDTCYQLIKGVYTYSFGKFNNLKIEISYNKDSLITSFMIYRKDSLQNKYIHNYINLSFPKGTSLLSDTTNGPALGHMFHCNTEFIVLTINNKNMLSRIDVYSSDTWKGQRYLFNNNFQRIANGSIEAEDKKGLWTEYHLNGNVKSVGFYDYRAIDEFDNVRIKVGVWKYYSLDGTEVKIENWENGIIVPNN